MTPGLRVDALWTNAAEALVVIPTLNEAHWIGNVLDSVAPCATAPGARLRVVVADGGSTDGTREIVQDRALEDIWLRFLDNPECLQGPGINRAVKAFGDGANFLIRLDAHARYNLEYCRKLLHIANEVGASSVVTVMRTVGRTPFQRGVAAAQNGYLGSGGAAHRMAREVDRSTGDLGRWVEHGHHALMRMDAFRAVGGYDPAFSHNEDAELDMRLTAAGHQIWMTFETTLEYEPRSSLGTLAAQYRNYGAGRARTLIKHRARPRLRQIVPLATPVCVAGVVAGAGAVVSGATGLALALVAPAAIWTGASLLLAVLAALRMRDPAVLWAGPAAMTMHLAWGVGFVEAAVTELRTPLHRPWRQWWT